MLFPVHGILACSVSDIGLRKEGGSVIVSVRISYVWSAEDLSHDHERPEPNVPRVVREILQKNVAYSGRVEFKLWGHPILFQKSGQGMGLCNFIQSPERRYPLVVFNGDDEAQFDEAKALAQQLTGKCLVAVITNNADLAEEIKNYLPFDYRIPFGKYRVFFPFNQQWNSPARHRWYNIEDEEYPQQRQGLVNGLLRNHILIEPRAVEGVDEVHRIAAQEELMKLKLESPDQHRQLKEFLTEHTRLASERDECKQAAEAFMNDAVQFEAENKQLKIQLNNANLKYENLQTRLNKSGNNYAVDFSELMPSLPKNLEQVAKLASCLFPNLVISEQALISASKYKECELINVAWEMLSHMNKNLYRLKFEENQKELELAFRTVARYELSMSEGKSTKRDAKLMGLRILIFDGREFDITPHVKYGSFSPNLLRIHFAFDEECRKIVIGHIGDHMRTAGTRRQ